MKNITRQQIEENLVNAGTTWDQLHALQSLFRTIAHNSRPQSARADAECHEMALAMIPILDAIEFDWVRGLTVA